MTEAISSNWTERAEFLQAKLARYPGPVYRKAYMAQMMANGSRLFAAGDSRSGSYCFEKVTIELAEMGEHEWISQSDSIPLESIEAARAKTSPLEILRHQWRKDRLHTTEAVLSRQGSRLSTLENKVYREKLEKLRAAGEKAVTKTQSSKVDAALLNLRGQLYKRILRSQRISLRPSQSPAAALRKALLLPKPHSKDTSSKTNPNEVNPKGKIAPVSLEAIIGPYNDRYNLGDFLTLLAQADAAWVEEFLELYRDLRDLKGLVSLERA